VLSGLDGDLRLQFGTKASQSVFCEVARSHGVRAIMVGVGGDQWLCGVVTTTQMQSPLGIGVAGRTVTR